MIQGDFHRFVGAKAVGPSGDPSTYWSSAFTDPAWLAVDLGAVHQVSRVRILWEAAFSKVFSVQVSTDGQAWSEVCHAAEGKGGTSEIKFVPVPARHVRVQGIERGTQWGHAIRELEVFE